jgi:hypothetical protein
MTAYSWQKLTGPRRLFWFTTPSASVLATLSRLDESPSDDKYREREVRPGTVERTFSTNSDVSRVVR